MPFPTTRPAGFAATTMLAALAVWFSAADPAAAQGPPNPQGKGETPFSNIVRRPSLSPYNSLAFQGNNPTTGATLGAIQGLLRPQQQQFAQQQQALRQARQLKQLQGQVRQIQRTPLQPQVQTIRATGHASTFLELSHFYPTAR